MSASMYNSPYVYKQPLPKITYPSLFSGCHISFKHVLDSKLQALAALLFVVSFVVNLIVVISPYWFKLVFDVKDGTFGNEAEKRELSINSGIFFINENEMDNLVELNKYNNQEVVPMSLSVAQMFEALGMCGLVACLAGSVIITLRRFSSVSANFILTFFAYLTGLFLLLGWLFALIMSLQSTCDPYEGGCNYHDNLKWRVLPIYSQFFRLEQVVTPYVKLNWTFYIAIIGAGLAIGAAVLLSLDACATYRSLTKIRYHQIRSVRDPHEGDINPAHHHKYVYQAPVKAGPMTYGMQPVAFQGGPYRAPSAPRDPYGPQDPYGAVYSGHMAPIPKQQPQERGGSVGFADDSFDKNPRQYSPPAGRRRSPPPLRRRSPSPDSGDDSPPPRFGRVGRGGGGSPPPRRRSPSPPSSAGGRRRSPPPRRGGPPSINSSMSEGPFVSKEIDL